MKLSPRYEGPAVLSIDGGWDDLFEPTVRQRRRFEAVLSHLDEDQWESASRCEGWTVHDVVAHLVGVNAFWQASVQAGLAGSPTRVLEAFDPAATPPLMVEPMRAMTHPEVFDQFVASNDGFLGALDGLDEAGWSAIAEAPPGHVPVRVLAHHALWDSWVHERDVTLPLGLVPGVEADEVSPCLRYAAALSPALAVSIATGSETSNPTFGVEATDPVTSFVLEVGESVSLRGGRPPDGAPVIRGRSVQLVEALSLRDPLPDATPAEWRVLLGGLATAFDAESATG